MLRLLLPGTVLLVLAGLQGATAAETGPLPCNTAGLTAPVALTSHIPPPEMYPPLSVVMGEAGATMVRYVVRPAGDVADATVNVSSGSLRLDDAAITFVQGFRFKPATKDGQPTACFQMIKVNWALRQQAPSDLSAIGGTVVHPIESDYPPAAKARHEAGTVVAMVVLNDKGAIELIQPVAETQFGDLNSASLALLRKQKFGNATVNGVGTRTVLVVRVVWPATDQPSGPAPATGPPPPTGTEQTDQAQHG